MLVFMVMALRRSPRGERGLKFQKFANDLEMIPSLPPRGAWIEISTAPIGLGGLGRSPRGERGLKYIRDLFKSIKLVSRSPRGERGLKYLPVVIAPGVIRGRSPRGERGLKCLWPFGYHTIGKSLPPRGAWIEIPLSLRCDFSRLSLPPRGAWIEILDSVNGNILQNGRSPRGERGLK